MQPAVCAVVHTCVSVLCREIADAAIGLKAQDVETNKIIELSKRVRLSASLVPHVPS